MKTININLLIFFLFFSIVVFSNKKAIKEEYPSELNIRIDSIVNRKVDSLFNLKKSSIDIFYESKLKTIENIKIESLEFENMFWKDEAFYVLAILAVLIGLTPLTFWIVDIVDKKTRKKINKIKQKIIDADLTISEYHTFQNYQELYFEDVIKPTIHMITDKLVEISKEKTIDEYSLSDITNQLYDFEKVIDLTHFNTNRVNEAIRYMKNRKSKYIKVKLRTLLDKISDDNLKLKIREILQDYQS